LSLKELTTEEAQKTDGGFLPLAVIVGIWAFQGAVALVALGMQARLNQEK
jgi:lactobin A/cerein 7B family class IIb bacteriocin